MKTFILCLLLSISLSSYAQFGDDLNCSPGVYDGRFPALDAQKRATFRYRTSPTGSSCTGCLINQSVNGKPKQYFLTARHCIYAGEYGQGALVNLGNFRFYFNFQSPNGNNDNVPQDVPFVIGNRGDFPDRLRYSFDSPVNLIYSSSFLPIGNFRYGIDMALLEIMQPIPPHFNVYYAGWKSDGLLGSGGVINAPMRMFHHPSGDTKKYGETLYVAKLNNRVASTCRVITKVLDAVIRFFGGNSVTEVVCDYVDVPQYEIPLMTKGGIRSGTSGSPWFTNGGRVFGALSAAVGECVNVGFITVGKFQNAYANRNLREPLNPSYDIGPNLFGIDGRDIGCYPDNPLRLSGDYFPARDYQPNNQIVISAQQIIEAGEADSDNNARITGRIDYSGGNGIAMQVVGANFGVEERRLRIYAGADFVFTAGQTIRLLPGFSVDQGGSFTGRIQSCNSGARQASNELETLSVQAPTGPITIEPATLVISPNPSTGPVRCQYTVRQTGKVRLSLLDAQGRELLNWLDMTTQQPGQYNTEKNLSELPAGLYLLRLETETGNVTERFVLQR